MALAPTIVAAPDVWRADRIYMVHRILDVREPGEQNELQVLIHWQDCEKSDATWEPGSHIHPRLLARYVTAFRTRHLLERDKVSPGSIWFNGMLRVVCSCSDGLVRFKQGLHSTGLHADAEDPVERQLGSEQRYRILAHCMAFPWSCLSCCD